MLPLKTLDRTRLRDGSEFSLAQRGDEWLISVNARILMSSRQHHSEDELALRALERVPSASRVLIGGLGMGYTTATALKHLGPDGRVTVAELVGPLVDWNRAHLGHLCGNPLQDPRCEVEVTDVYDVLGRSAQAFDVVLLDVDNGPVALSADGNQRLYSMRGVRHCLTAVRPGGVLGVWSVGPSERFEQRLRSAGATPEVLTVASRPGSKTKHYLFLARV